MFFTDTKENLLITLGRSRSQLSVSDVDLFNEYVFARSGDLIIKSCLRNLNITYSCGRSNCFSLSMFSNNTNQRLADMNLDKTTVHLKPKIIIQSRVGPFVTMMLTKQRRAMRHLFMLPAKGQSARTNAKTTRRIKLWEFKAAERIRGLARCSPGVLFGSRAKARKIKSKLKPKLSKITKKKGPVIRSKHTKKSVWG